MTDENERQVVDASRVRSWARTRGFEVGNRGHLPSDVVDAFNRRHRIVRFENKNPIVRGVVGGQR